MYTHMTCTLHMYFVLTGSSELCIFSSRGQLLCADDNGKECNVTMSFVLIQFCYSRVIVR